MKRSFALKAKLFFYINVSSMDFMGINFVIINNCEKSLFPCIYL